MDVVAILLCVGAAALGIYQARVESAPPVRAATAAALLGISNVLACWPYFIADPATWYQTFSTGLWWTGWVSALVHVAPFLAAHRIAKRYCRTDEAAA